MKRLAFVLCGIFACAFGADKYVVDASHSSVGFSVKHMSVSNVRGSFNTFSGTFEVDGKTIKALNGEVQVASINTNNESRDKHLNAPDFFDSKKFPKATLTLIKHNGKKLEANLTLRDVTKKVTFDVELSAPAQNPQSKKQIIALTLKGSINRKDFGIALDSANAMLSDNVDIQIELEAAQG